MGWPKGKPRKVKEDVSPAMSYEEVAVALAITPIDMDKPRTPESMTRIARVMAYEPDQVGHALYEVVVPPSCADCRFWHPTGEANHGQCRRFPAHARNNSPYAHWPVMTATDWCGEFKAKD